MTTADAHFIQPLKNIEVQITFQKTRFKAICSAFPDCKGFGKSEEEAVEKLCKSISKIISHVAETLVENVIREAIHPTKATQSRPQNLSAKKAKAAKTKQDTLPLLSYPEDRMLFRVPPDQDIHTLMDRLQGPSDYDMPLHSEEIEGFYMGFPLSLN